MSDNGSPSRIALRLVDAVEEQLTNYHDLSRVLKTSSDKKLITRFIQLLLVLEWLYQLTITVSARETSKHGNFREWLLANHSFLKNLVKECELPKEVGEKQFIIPLFSLLKAVRDELARECGTSERLSLISLLLQQDLLGEIYNLALTGQRKKLGGIYHTPWTVIDFIISVTVKKQLETLFDNFQRTLTSGKQGEMRDAWDKILDYRVIDPACGSGRFLMRAIPHLLELHSKTFHALDLREDKETDESFLGLDKKHFLQFLPFLVIMRHLHGIDLDEDAVLTCRLNTCVHVIMESFRHELSLFDEDSVFKEFLQLFQASKLNFHVGNALVGCFPCKEDIRSDEKNDHHCFPESEIRHVDFLELTPPRALELVRQREQLAARMIQHLKAVFQEEGFPDSIFKVTIPYCWHEKINRSRMQGFDAVVGNPPYFRIREISRKNPAFRVIYQYLKKSSRWSLFFRAASDIYYYFILLGIQLLKPNGKLGFIVGNYWIENDNADLLKKELLSKSRVDFLVQFTSQRVFEGVNEDTCILILTRKESTRIEPDKPVRYLLVKNIELLKKIPKQAQHLNAKEGMNEITEVLISHHFLGTKKWMLREQHSFPAKLRIDGIKVIPLGDIRKSNVKEYPNLFKKKIQMSDKTILGLCRIGRGMQTGRNDIFRVQLLKELDDDVILVHNRKHDVTAPIEKKFLKKAVRNSFIKRYHLKKLEWIIFIPPGVQIDNYPLVREYLSRFEEELQNRYEYKEGKCKWYEYSMYRNLSLQQAPHYLLAPYRAKLNVFSRNVEPVMVFDDCVVIVPKSNRLEMTRYLLGVLNSSVVTYWLSLAGKKKGNLYELFSTVLARIPIPHPESSVVREINEAVSNLEETFTMRAMAAGDKTGARVGRGEFSSFQHWELENLIDALVFQAYGFTSREMLSILKKIGKKEERITLVKEFFRKY